MNILPGDLITYHGGTSKASQTISKFSKWAGQWPEEYSKNEYENSIYKDCQGFNQSNNKIVAPSHVLIAAGKNEEGEQEFVEASWGKNVIPFWPFWKKEVGIRVVTISEIRKRSGFHVVWRMDLKPEQRESISQRLYRDCAREVGYDKKGLFSAAKMTLSQVLVQETTKSKFFWKYAQNPKEYFCSELFAAKIATVTNEPPTLKKKILPAYAITPALAPQSYKLKPVKFIF